MEVQTEAEVLIERMTGLDTATLRREAGEIAALIDNIEAALVGASDDDDPTRALAALARLMPVAAAYSAEAKARLAPVH
jgi:hypothetical protein